MNINLQSSIISKIKIKINVGTTNNFTDTTGTKTKKSEQMNSAIKNTYHVVSAIAIIATW
jgi:hypothetical protein